MVRARLQSLLTLPSVAIKTARSVSLPPLTPRLTLIVDTFLVEENTVTASATLRHIISSGGPIIFWQATTGRINQNLLQATLTLERGTLRLRNRQTLIYSILFRGVTTHDLTVILNGSPTITPLSRVRNEIGHYSTS
jgi:hypothetical protein